MTLEHNAPDMVCPNNVSYPITTEMPDQRRQDGITAHQWEHLCPGCLAELGWSVTGDLDNPEWPFIGCYSFHAAEVSNA